MLLSRLITSLVAAGVLLALVPVPASAADVTGPRVLLFTKVADAEHAHRSTPDAIDLLEMNSRRYGYQLDAGDDAAVFTAEGLADYDVVMFLNTHGDILTDAQQDAFETWMRDGGGFVGVHGAARTEPDWDYYHDLVGAFAVEGEGAPMVPHDVSFDTERPAGQFAPVDMNDHTDQWYEFDRDPGKLKKTQIIGTAPLTDSTAQDPVTWARTFEGGRSWYTSLGHAAKAYEDGNFTKLLRSGIWWAADREQAPRVQAADAAPGWPYGLSFLAWIAAVAVGGAVAVIKLNRRETLA